MDSASLKPMTCEKMTKELCVHKIQPCSQDVSKCSEMFRDVAKSPGDEFNIILN